MKPSTIKKHAVTGVIALVCLAAFPARGQDNPQPMSLEGAFGRFTERRPAPTEFASEAERQRTLRIQYMTALSGLYRVLVAEPSRNSSAVELQKPAAHALATMAAQIPSVFRVPSPAPEGASGALPLIWDVTKKEEFNALTESFKASAESLRNTVGNGGDVRRALYAVRYHCIACHSIYRSAAK